MFLYRLYRASASSIGLVKNRIPSFVNLDLNARRYIFNDIKCLRKNESKFGHTVSVKKDIVLFEGKKSRKLNIIAVSFGLSQGIFWAYMADFTFSFRNMKKIKADQSDENKLTNSNRISIWETLFNIDYKTNVALSIGCLAVGIVICYGTWIMSLRSVITIHLKKGGNILELVTHTPWFKPRTINVPVTNVTSKTSLEAAKSYHAIKIKGYRFNFIVDKTGKFENPVLYNNTICISRNLRC